MKKNYSLNKYLISISIIVFILFIYYTIGFHENFYRYKYYISDTIIPKLSFIKCQQGEKGTDGIEPS